MGKAYGFAEGTGILPSLPIADMSTGAVGIVTTMQVFLPPTTVFGRFMRV